jgi:23S rRNA (guanosine2251-2'-O)-methyltransferase
MSSNKGDTLYGRNPVLETLRAGRRQIYSIKLARGVKVEGSLEQLVSIARERDISIAFVHRKELDHSGLNHQGVTAETGPYPYVDLTAIRDRCDRAGQEALVLVLDMLQDPQNLGTLLRSAEAVGVVGVVIPNHRSASVSPAVVSASAGASEYLLIARHNLAQAMVALKEDQFWIAGLDQGSEAQPYTQASFARRTAIVVGNEGAGLRRLVRESCDFLVEIPMDGQISSLNAAVAGSIVLYAARLRRNSASIDGPSKSW